MVPHNSKILLYIRFVDMRKSINGLSILVAGELGESITDTVYIFYNKSYRRLKLL